VVVAQGPVGEAHSARKRAREFPRNFAVLPVMALRGC
jgi:hypothetical protein